MVKTSDGQSSLSRVRSAARFADHPAGTFLICSIFSLLMIYHFVIPFNAILTSDGTVWNDPAHSIWSLWLVNENVSSLHSPYRTDLVFYPLGADLTHHTLSPGFVPVTFLVKKFSGGSPMYPIYAYRIIVWLCFTLLLFFTYLFLRQLEFTRWAAAIGATAFAFCDFFIEHAPHLSLLSAFFVPLTALLLLRVYRRPATRSAIAAGLSAGVAVYFTELALYIFLALFFVLITIGLMRAPRQTFAVKLRELGLRRLLLMSVVCLALMIPFLLNHFSSHISKPLSIESANFSANLPGFVIPEPRRKPLYGGMFAALSARMTKGSDGRETFIGFPILVFAVIGLAALRQKIMWAAAAVGLAFLVLSLGPTLKVFGAETGMPLPYALLMKVPPFDLGRTPVRFVMMGIFFLKIVAAGGITWIQQSLTSRLGKRWITAVLLSVFAWVVAESYAPLARQPSFHPPVELARLTNGPVLNLPASRFDGYAALLQVFHHQPIATGYISRFSDEQINHVEDLARLVDMGGPGLCPELSRMGIRNIILNPVRVIDAPYELSECGLNVIDLRRKDFVYPPYQIGKRIDFTSSDAGRYLGYGWSVAEPLARWSDRGRAVVAFSIAGPTAATLRLKLAPFLVAGKLDQQRMNLKLNDQIVTSLILNTSEPSEFSIPLPPGVLREKNILTFDLPDATAPKSLRVSEDTRRLGISVQWLEIDL
ncbi:MAG: hypothetical protein QOD75_620 [Blastocatellia bacterium]|jgi:hypothetical protein|nr:hypothetical protein [Blastocatellia bacterium]